MSIFNRECACDLENGHVCPEHFHKFACALMDQADLEREAYWRGAYAVSEANRRAFLMRETKRSSLRE